MRRERLAYRRASSREDTPVLRSVRRHRSRLIRGYFGRSDRRAQGDRSTLRSIRPTRARRPFDASVDPTDARFDPCGRIRLLFGRSPIEQGHTPGRTGRRRAAILMPAPWRSTSTQLSGRRGRSTRGARTGSLAEGTAEAGRARPGHRARRGRPGRQARLGLEEPRIVRHRRRAGRRLVKISFALRRT
jgi:hypothetical protein